MCTCVNLPVRPAFLLSVSMFQLVRKMSLILMIYVSRTLNGMCMEYQRHHENKSLRKYCPEANLAQGITKFPDGQQSNPTSVIHSIFAFDAHKTICFFLLLSFQPLTPTHNLLHNFRGLLCLCFSRPQQHHQGCSTSIEGSFCFARRYCHGCFLWMIAQVQEK